MLQYSRSSQWRTPHSLPAAVQLRSAARAGSGTILCSSPSQQTFISTIADGLLFQRSIAFQLATRDCYALPIAKWMSDALGQQLHLQPASIMDIHTALHEAICNAVIHGNLGIHGKFQNRAEFTAYCNRVEDALRSKRNRRRVLISTKISHACLTLRVSDEGEGYCSTPYVGKGLSVIHACSGAVRIFDNGSTIEMDFALQ